jgi:hypothetical protein
LKAIMFDTKKRIEILLDGLQQHIAGVTAELESPALAPALKTLLHDPDRLPDKATEKRAAELVDSLDKLQLQLLPSVSLLTDGFFGYLDSKVLSTVVSARVADILGEHGPLPTAELAARACIQPERLDQLLDALVNKGIFTITSDESASPLYANNRASTLLMHSHWTQWHRWADLYPNDFYDLASAIPQAVATGESRNAAQIGYGLAADTSLYGYLKTQPALADKFHRTLGAGAGAQAAGLPLDYPWGDELAGECVLDIGGGNGEFLASILRAHPLLRGSVLDLGNVIDLARHEYFGDAGRFRDVADRVQDLIEGDFLEAVPPSNIYVMKWCLHNWGDDMVVKIFQNVRRAIRMGEGGAVESRFLVFESVKQPGRSARLSRYGDLVMMMTTNGKERFLDDWLRLAQLGGWRIEKIHPIRRAWPCAIDLRPI